VGETETALKQRHNERNATAAGTAGGASALDSWRQNLHRRRTRRAGHEEICCCRRSGGHQPVRTIEFPKDFRETPDELAEIRGAGTLTMLGGSPRETGRICRPSGEGVPDISRQRSELISGARPTAARPGASGGLIPLRIWSAESTT